MRRVDGARLGYERIDRFSTIILCPSLKGRFTVLGGVEVGVILRARRFAHSAAV